jgi:hypothetical protein
MAALGLGIGKVARVLWRGGCANAPFYMMEPAEGTVARIKAAPMARLVEPASLGGH